MTLSRKDGATALDCSESKISRTETGERGIYADDVAAILEPLRLRRICGMSYWHWSATEKSETGTSARKTANELETPDQLRKRRDGDLQLRADGNPRRARLLTTPAH